MWNIILLITIIIYKYWSRFSSSSWVEYFYMYYDDIVRETRRAINESVINS